MKTQHTPTYRAQPLEGPGHYQIIDESCRQVALVRYWPEEDGETSAASRVRTAKTAELFASAPELLAALEAFLNARGSGSDSYTLDEAEHLARQAIARATV